MRLKPIFEVVCECGQPVTGETKELKCKCGLAITAEWPCVTRLEADGRITQGEVQR
jgi:hypothetical protein